MLRKTCSSKAHREIGIITSLLVLLFFYTAVSKLLDLDEFERQLSRQTLPVWSHGPLLWLIPGSEVIVASLLVYRPTRRAGFYASTVLMLFFTGYMGLVLLKFFDRIPCSCGGVIGDMGFGAHFVFNTFFLALSILGICICNPGGRRWNGIE